MNETIIQHIWKSMWYYNASKLVGSFCLIKDNVCLRHATKGLFYGLHIQKVKRKKKKKIVRFENTCLIMV